MSKSRKPVNKKKVIKIVLISLAVFIVLNFIGAAIGTSTSITHPKLESYENRENYTKQWKMWGNFDSYDKDKYIVKGKDGFELHVTSVSSPETRGTGKYVIISHGHKSNQMGIVKFVDPYIELGFTCIIYDLRGHGANEKAICSMGGFEAEDLNYLIEDTVSKDSTNQWDLPRLLMSSDIPTRSTSLFPTALSRASNIWFTTSITICICILSAFALTSDLSFSTESMMHR